MNLFKILAIITVVTFKSFACYYTSCEKLKEFMDKVSLHQIADIPELCLILENGNTRTLLDIKLQETDAEKKAFNDFILEKIINNKDFIEAIEAHFSDDLSPWQKRAMEKFLNDDILTKEKFFHLEGKKDHFVNEKGFTILNFNYFPIQDLENRSRLVSDIIAKDTDVVCLEGIFCENDAEFFYDHLKKNYKHFYVDIGLLSERLNTGLFVASKFEVENPKLKFFQDISYFDFFIKNMDKSAHIYLVDLQLVVNGELELEKLTEKLIQKDANSVPTILCYNLKDNPKSTSDCIDNLLINENLQTMFFYQTQSFFIHEGMGVLSVFFQQPYENSIFEDDDSSFFEIGKKEIDFVNEHNDFQ